MRNEAGMKPALRLTALVTRAGGGGGAAGVVHTEVAASLLQPENSLTTMF